VGGLAFAAAPLAAAGAAYGLVLVAFLWQLFGALLDVPAWALDLSPFHQVGLVPAESFKAGAAITMVVLAALMAVAAVRLFRRRDLVAG
jgi:ABC-2 type transport system permease protein